MTEVDRLRRQVVDELWAAQQRILGDLVARLRAYHTREADEIADRIEQLLD